MNYQIPALPFGDPFLCTEALPITDLASGDQLGTIHPVVPNRIEVDVMRKQLLRRGRDALLEIPIADRIRMSEAAADYVEKGTLDCGGVAQSPDDYNEVVSRTSGLPLRLARENTSRFCAAMRMTGKIIDGLSCGMPREIFDAGFGHHNGQPVRLRPRIDGLGCCMPNNSPGVHVTWAPVPAFGIPVLVRPGSSEPFTPLRIIQGLIKAGFPKEAFGFYPCDHAGANVIPELTKGAIVFGRDDTVQKWRNYPLVQAHGAGLSKLIIGEDQIENWRALIPEMARNVAANSGRSCFTVSLIIVPKYRDEIAAALAEELAKITPRPRQDPEAVLSALSMPTAGNAWNSVIEAGLKAGGASDVSAAFRTGNRLVVVDGLTYMLPTVVTCDTREHTLANQEFMFPFTAVTEMSNEDALANLGPTLSLAIYTKNEKLRAKARWSNVSLLSFDIDTSRLDRRQPHQENLFHLLWERLSEVAA